MLSNSTKRFILKLFHILLIVSLLMPLLPQRGMAQPLPVRRQRDTSVDEAFEALKAEFKRYFTEAQRSSRQFEPPFGGQQGLEGFGLPASSAPSPWQMLPEAPQSGSEGLNRAHEGSSLLPQPLDPNAQNASLLEALLPQLAEMPPDETDTLPAPMAPIVTFVNTPTIPPTAEAEQAAKEGTPPANAAQMIALQATPPATTPTPTPPAQAKAVTSPAVTAQDNPDPDLITSAGGQYTSPDKHLSVTIPEDFYDERVEGSHKEAEARSVIHTNKDLLQSDALAAPFMAVDPCAVDVQLAPEFPFVHSEDPMGIFYSGNASFDHYPGTLVYLTPQQTPLGDATPADFGTLQTLDYAVMQFPNGGMNVTSASNLEVTAQFPPYPFIPLPFAVPAIYPPPIQTNVSIQMVDPSPESTWGSTAYYLVRDDITNPQIVYGYTLQDGFGGIYVLVEVYDNCAIDRVEINYTSTSGGSGTQVMTYLGGFGNGNGFYGVALSLPVTGINSYTVTAYDMALPVALTDVWTSDENSMNDRDAGDRCTKKCTSFCGCPFGHGVSGDPVDTATGNFTYQEEDAVIPGVSDLTDIAIRRFYNSVKVERYFTEPHESGIFDNGTVKWLHSPFGLGWSSDQYFFIEIMDNLMLQGAKVNYPDGHSSRYQGSSGILTPLSAGESDILEAAGGGYILRQKDFTTHEFDGQGRLLRTTDANGNRVQYTQSANGPTTISNSAGRSINLTYSTVGGQSVITSITDGSGLLNLSYTYQVVSETDTLGVTRTGAVLASSTDSRGQTTQYTYDGNHYLTGIITPKGHNALQLQYDANGRVLQQTIGTSESYNISYDDINQRRTIVDGNGYSEIHQYNNDYLLTSRQDNRGVVESYTYSGENLRQSLTNGNGNSYTYTYDARHNLVRTDGPLGWSLEFSYNAQDRPLTMTDAEGRTTEFAYDGAGNLTTITNADDDTMTLSYDRGLPETMTDFNDHVIVNTYNAAGDLEQVQNGEGEVLTIAYDGLGRMTSMTTHEGHSFSFAYDGGSDLLTALTGHLGYATAYNYDANGNLASQTDARGNTTSYQYDDSENLVQVTDALNGIMSFTYDNMNNLATQTDELGRVATYAYDETYNVIETNTPENRTTTLTYDNVGNLTTITDAEGHVTTLTYDQLDRLTDITDALSGVTTMTYDLVGNITSINDANGHVTTYLYDDLDRLTDETNAESESTHYDYDDNGNLTAVIDAETNQTALTYDAANRLTSITNAENEIVTFAYDSLGNISDLVQPNTVPIHWEYDALYRPIELIQNYQPAAAGDTETNVTYQFEYDLNGNLELVRDPLTNESSFEYDELNRLTRDVNALGDDIVYVYNAVDNLISVTDRRNNTTELDYDEANRLTDVTDALDGISSYSYDRVDNLTSYADENNHATMLEYDDLNRLETVTNPETHLIELAYDAVGNVTQFTDARSASTTLEYDDVNRLIRATDALNGETELQYDEVGNVTQVSDANDHVTLIGYDLAYRTTSITDAEAYITRFEYDDNGNITLVEDGNSNVTEVAYDALDRILSVTNAENETTAYTYDAIGNLIDTIENDGVTKRNGYDDIYRLTAVTLNHNGTGTALDSDILYQYGYDANGNLTSITDPLTHITTFQYDELNRMTRETNPLANRWDYNYDPADNLIERIDGNNNSTTYDYYPDDQLQTINYDDGTSVAFEYDPNNNLTQMADSLGTTNLSYDALNRLTNVNDALGRSLAYGYDPVGNLTSMTYPHGGTVQYGYFDNDWLETVSDTAGRVTTYERNGVGQMTSTVFANGAISTNTYDDANRLRSITHSEDGGELISSYSYTLNEVGLRTSAEIAYGRPWPKTVTESYEYDGLRRLTGVTDDLGFAASYDYDQVGNRTRWAANDDQTTQEAGDAFDITYSYNEANQLLTQVQDDESTTYSYDANGNRTNKHWTQTDYPYQYGTDYAYDREDRLTSATNYRINDSLETGHRRNKDETRLAYDGMGRRLSKEYIEHDGRGRVAFTEYVFDGLDVVAEYPVWEEAEFRGRNNHRNEFYYNDNMQIVSQRRFPNGVAAQNYNYHYDGRMNVVSLTEETNRAWVHYQYDAYGQQLPAWGNTPHPEWHEHNQYKVTGKEWDDKLGMSYFGSRYYESSTAQWPTQDAYRGTLGLPVTLHRYGYVHANPINLYDYYGYQTDIPAAVEYGKNGEVTLKIEIHKANNPPIGECNINGIQDAVKSISSNIFDYVKKIGGQVLKHVDKLVEVISPYVYDASMFTLGAASQFIDSMLLNVPSSISSLPSGEESFLDRVSDSKFQQGRLFGENLALAFGVLIEGIGTLETGVGLSGVSIYGGICVVSLAGGGTAVVGCPVAVGVAAGSGVLIAKGALLTTYGSTVALRANRNIYNLNKRVQNSTGSSGSRRIKNLNKSESPVWKKLENYKKDIKKGGSGKKTRYYRWDHTHDDIEVYNHKGRHLGSMNPVTGEMYKGPVSGRTLH